MNLAIRYLFSLGFLPFILNQTADNDLFYCVDWNCEEFISRGKTLLNYAGKTDSHLSFKQNEDIKILGKPVNIDGPDWIGTVRKKIGLVPKSMVREEQMGKRSANFKYPLPQLLEMLIPLDDKIEESLPEAPSIPPTEVTISDETENSTTLPSLSETENPNSDVEDSLAESPIALEANSTSSDSDAMEYENTTELPQVSEPEKVTESILVSEPETNIDSPSASEPETTESTPISEEEEEDPTDEEAAESLSPPEASEEEEVPISDETEPLNSDAEEISTETPAIIKEIISEPPPISEPETSTESTLISEPETTESPPVSEPETSTESAAIFEEEVPVEVSIVPESLSKSTAKEILISEEEEKEEIPISDETESSTTSPSLSESEPPNSDVEESLEELLTTFEANSTSSDLAENTAESPPPPVSEPERTTESTKVSEPVEISTESTTLISEPETTESTLVFESESTESTTVSEPEEMSTESILISESKTTESTLVSEEVPMEAVESLLPPTSVEDEVPHNHNHHDHGHSHSHNERSPDTDDTSSFVIIAKHLSSTLLSFLPEHLQDTILDVDDALVLVGIIALTLVSICVPYFLIDGFFAVRPLKKKVVDLNKSLWKVSTAYENQQDEYELYKKKALAYDEDKKRVEQLEYELILLKKLEGKQKEQVVKYQKELKTHKELTTDMQSFLDKEAEKKKKIFEEKDKLKTTVTSLKEALRRTVEDLQDAQTQMSEAVMEFELAKQSNETLSMKSGMLDKELNELKTKLLSEVDRRRAAENDLEEEEKSKAFFENELAELKKICLKYEDTVSSLNTELEHKDNELLTLKETLGEDSPLVDIAEVKAKLMNAEETVTSLESRVESLSLENSSLSRNLKDATSSLSTVQKEREEAMNRLQVLESWFKEKEEDLRKAVERYEAERNIRGKDKDDLVKMLEDRAEEIKQLNSQLEAFKGEFEETKQQHRNEIRALETKSHENWLSLCQAERKAQDARKDAEALRQRLTALSKEKEEGEGVNGDMMYPLITPDMVPLPLPDDDIASYFDLHDGFIPLPPLPLDQEREPHRPAPLGRVSPTYSDLDDPISPIRRGREFSDGNSSGSESSPRRRSPSGWTGEQYDRDRDRDRDAEERHRRTGPVTASSPIHGLNL